MVGFSKSAFITAVLCAASLVLTFLCLFAGSKKSFMEEYSLLTVSALDRPQGRQLANRDKAQHLSDWPAAVQHVRVFRQSIFEVNDTGIRKS